MKIPYPPYLDTHQASIVEMIAWNSNSSAKQDIFWPRARQLLPSQRPVQPRGGHLRLGVSSPNICVIVPVCASLLHLPNARTKRSV